MVGADAPSSDTVIRRFVQVASSPEYNGAQVMDCCGDSLTYAQLLSLASGIAAQLREKFGEKPVVSIVSDNNPYVLSVILATWLLGGIAAPLDFHAPEAILRGMLEGIRPDCVVLPETSEGNVKLLADIGITALPFKPSESGISNLLKTYASGKSSIDPSLLSTPDDIALYLYTSSASSTANLKCVPIHHGMFFSNAHLELAMWRVRNGITRDLYGACEPERFRTLGWGPFSHIMGLAHDLTCHVVLVVGCYIFAVPPSTYPAPSSSTHLGAEYDIGTILLETAKRAKADVISGVPWLYKRLMAACEGHPEYLELLKKCRQLLSGGALTDPEIEKWAEDHRLNMDVSLGMTELGGALFEVDIKTMADGGYPINQVLVRDAKLTLVDDDGKENDSYGELVISSPYVARGYHNFTSVTHKHDRTTRVTTFYTGDKYSLTSGRLLWEGRKEDYIQLGSAEILDPRGPERELTKSPAIARAALVGNRFLRGAADFVCAIVEVPDSGFDGSEMMRAFAQVNKGLHPPLRVPVSRVLVLEHGENIPMSRKGLIWRKALEERFGSRLSALLNDPALSKFGSQKRSRRSKKSVQTLEAVESEVAQIVAEGLGVPRSLVDENGDSTFAELGMDSNMATRIVSKLNARFVLDLPMSACHDYVDLATLSQAIFEKLTASFASSSVISPRTHLDYNDGYDVVIVGQAFRLPGKVNTASAFWDALVHKKQVLEPMGNDRWDHDSFYHPPTNPPSKPPPGKINFTQMGRIEVASYDNAFFGISPAEAYFVTPGARVAMEVAVEALEDANIPLSSVKGSNMGVFVAQGPEFGYPDLIYTEKGFEVYDRYYGTGVADSAISGRLSYFLDIHGPSVTLNTACSGGLVALDNALLSIRHGISESAIVCSVNVHVWPGNFGFLSANQMSSLHGRCATFSKDADGYVPSEGAMAFVVKSKRAALRDGDNIIGIVKSTSVQHNGRSQGLVAPNSKAQVALQKTVLAAAGILPKDVDFVENHGTGTILGDMMEIQAINEVFGGSHNSESPLILGAAKTIFGHTESTAGLVGVAKALQSLHHHTVPGLAHLDGTNLSPRLDTNATPLRISHLETQLRRRAEGIPLRALSLSFGFAGTIAAVILEEYLPNKTVVSPEVEVPVRPAPHLFLVSAKTEKALMEYLRYYIEYCKQAQESDLANICYTSCVGREHYRFRFACTCTTLKELLDQLNDAVESALKKPFPAIPSKPRVAFAFPGQGSQWQGMGRALSDVDKSFAGYLMEYVEQASDLLGIDLAPLLFEYANAEKPTNVINETHVSQACIFIYQCAMVRWLEHIGIRPNAVVAHSLGEIAAAVTSGSIEFDVALEFVVARSNAMRPERTNGGLMAAIRAPVEPINKRIAALGLSDVVTIAAFNTNTQHVVSGDEEAVRKLVDDLAKKSIKATVLSVNQGFHSHCIEPSLKPIREHVESITNEISKPTIPFFSSVEGRALKSEELPDANYWVKQARQPVRFADAARAMLNEANCNVVIDVGPQTVIAHLLKDASSGTPKAPSIASVCDRPTTNTLAPLVQSLATLYTLGITPNFQQVFAGRRVQAKKVAIPTYPWQKQRHYPSIIPSRTTKIKGLQQSDDTTRVWEIGKELGSLLEKDHTVDGVPIIPAAALAMFVPLEAGKARSNPVMVDIRFQKPLLLETPSNETLKLEIRNNAFTCVHYREGIEKGVICSGNLHPVSASSPISTKGDQLDQTLSKNDVYEKFASNLVRFGPSFQCIQSIEVYGGRAVGLIEVVSSSNPQHDFVRKMDAILHMFGAIAPEAPPELRSGGSFLPSAVNGLVIHASTFPERLVCTYRLPIKVSQNSKRMSADFDVRSEAGELLAECKDYNVSWVPSTMPLVARPAPPKGGLPLMRTIWTQVPLKSDAEAKVKYDLVYVGSGRLREALGVKTKVESINLHEVNDVKAFLETQNGSYHIVYDGTSIDGQRMDEDSITLSSSAALSFVKSIAPYLGSNKVKSAIVITRGSLQILPSDVDSSDAISPPIPSRETGSLLGSIVQGMVRVLRHELNSRSIVAIDLPQGASQSEECAIFLRELASQSNSQVSPVAYRYSPEQRLLRMEPRLVEDGFWVPPTKDAAKKKTCAVIFGMKALGIELAKHMVQRQGWSHIIFIDKRNRGDIDIASTLINLESDGVELDYVQADITSRAAVRDALVKIYDEFGPIHSIVYHPESTKDSTIDAATDQGLSSTLNTVAVGAWNVYLACEDLKLNVERLLMLSSISVTIGKPGQLLRVASYSLLDAIAAFYSSVSPCDALSVQLGAWDSQNETERFIGDAPVIAPMSYEEGVPLLLKALEDARVPSVSILAKARFGYLRGKEPYSSDPYFESILSSATPEKAAELSPRPGSGTSAKRSTKIAVPAVEKSLTRSLQKILGLSSSDVDNLDSSTPVLSLGIDSISFTQLRADVSESFEVDLPMTFLGEETLTLADLAEFIVEAAREQSGSETSDQAASEDTLVTDSDITAKDAEKFISSSLQSVLGMTSADMENFDSSTPVLSLGIDSISFTQLRADVMKKYGVDVPMSFLGEETLTLGELAEFTVEKAREEGL
uniref:Putative water-soluble melanin synthase n=1 Tax=Inonotus obliquus TaxID=167356 RepID=A0A0F6TM89_9AGAM|nr:putative water-soluble melanin synthase [Inonotus obliquus]